jgi:uncharacterized SAM-binding protein YcdF (DUF218 family)
MFFILSKLLAFLVRPIIWIAVLLLYGLWGKKNKWKKRSLVLGVIFFFIFTNHFLFNLCMNVWEVETQTTEQLQEVYDIGILLGGYSNFNIRPNHDRHNFSERANRFNNALELYHKGKIKKILLTGGSGSLVENEPSEAPSIQNFLILSGVPDSNIIVEGASRNTWENALLSKEILDRDYPDASCLLITSAWHMRRAQGCFNKARVPYTPFSTDHMSEKIRPVPESILFPDRLGLYRWELLVREIVGYIMYWLQGYIA